MDKKCPLDSKVSTQEHLEHESKGGYFFRLSSNLAEAWPTDHQRRRHNRGSLHTTDARSFKSLHNRTTHIQARRIYRLSSFFFLERRVDWFFILNTTLSKRVLINGLGAALFTRSTALKEVNFYLLFTSVTHPGALTRLIAREFGFNAPLYDRN